MPWYQKLFWLLVLIFGGVTVLGSLLSAISNALALVSRNVALIGSIILLASWAVMEVVTCWRGLRWMDKRGQMVTLRRLGPMIRGPLLGILLLLWIPPLIGLWKNIMTPQPPQIAQQPSPQESPPLQPPMQPQRPSPGGNWRDHARKDAFTFTPFEVVPDARSTALVGINDAGDVIGSYGLGDSRAPRFLLLADGTRSPIEHPQEASPDATAPTGLNNHGEVVGFFYETKRGRHGQLHHAFVRRRDGTFESFDCLGSSYTAATAVNDRGQIVGWALDDTGAQQPFLRESDGSCTPITPPEADVFGQPTGINNKGEIIGMWNLPKIGERSFLRRPDGTFIAIQPDPGVRVEVTAINDDGDVVGRTAFGGFVWRRDAPTLALEHPRCRESLCTFPRGINGRGHIIGTFDIGNNTYSFLAVPRGPKGSGR